MKQKTELDAECELGLHLLHMRNALGKAADANLPFLPAPVNLAYDNLCYAIELLFLALDPGTRSNAAAYMATLPIGDPNRPRTEDIFGRKADIRGRVIS